MNKLTCVVLAMAALVVGVLLWMTLGGDSVPERRMTRAKNSLIRDTVTDKRQAKDNEKRKAVAEQSWRKDKKDKSENKDFRHKRVVVIDDYSPADRKLADAVQEALDDEDFEKMREAAAAAMKSENPDVRQEAVDALAWFDDKALVDLTRAMADKNADVAESARGHVENALMGMEDDDRAFVLASEYVKMFAGDEDAVAMFAGVLSAAGSRIIDPDDSDSAEDVAKAKGNRAGIVDIVDEMIGKGGKLAEKGKELYEEISGDEWTDRATADKWANDIEEPGHDETESGESSAI